MRTFRPERVPRFTPDPELLPRLADRAGFDLEIGAGAGLHAVRYALAHPDRLLVAVERTAVKFAGLRGRHLAHGAPPNLIPLRADAVSFVTHFVRPNQLERIFLLYPNPYPKAKHANLRWYNSPFVSELVRKLKPGGSLTLATNLAWYAAGAREGFRAAFGLSLEVDRAVDPAAVPRTHFEKKYLARGERCFDLVFRRPDR